jgi:hypothetical protein
MDGRHENRVEFSGALVALAVVAVIAVLLVGSWFSLLAALIVTAVLALTAIALLVAWSVRKSHPAGTEGPRVEHAIDGRHRILVVADATCAVSQLVEELRSRAGAPAVSVFVMAPALETRLGLLTDDQKAYDRSTARLEEMLEALARAGLPAQGEVGSSDPLQAAEDGLRQFPADQIVFITNPEGKSNWLEEDVVTIAESRFEQPVTHVAAG